MGATVNKTNLYLFLRNLRIKLKTYVQKHVEEYEDMIAVDGTIEGSADYDGATPFKWRSQPSLLGRAAGNILLSFSSLMAGASISKVLLAFRHFGLVVYSPRIYYRHQSEMIIPPILIYWESYQASLI